MGELEDTYELLKEKDKRISELEQQLRTSSVSSLGVAYEPTPPSVRHTLIGVLQVLVFFTILFIVWMIIFRLAVGFIIFIR